MQRELLNRTSWDSHAQLAPAMLEWVEGFYSPAAGAPASATSAADYEVLHAATEIAA